MKICRTILLLSFLLIWALLSGCNPDPLSVKSESEEQITPDSGTITRGPSTTTATVSYYPGLFKSGHPDYNQPATVLKMKFSQTVKKENIRVWVKISGRWNEFIYNSQNPSSRNAWTSKSSKEIELANDRPKNTTSRKNAVRRNNKNENDDEYIRNSSFIIYDMHQSFGTRRFRIIGPEY